MQGLACVRRVIALVSLGAFVLGCGDDASSAETSSGTGTAGTETSAVSTADATSGCATDCGDDGSSMTGSMSGPTDPSDTTDPDSTGNETGGTCDDAEMNGDETDVDCGGACPACPDGAMCIEDDDCESELCVAGVCEAEGEPLPAADYYVDGTNGDDDNPGTAAQPFATIQRGVDAAGPGDIVQVADGVYFEAVDISNKGTSENGQLWLRAENPGGVVLSGALQGPRLGTANWQNDGGGTWSIAHNDDVWGGFHLESEAFLLRFKTRNHLESVSIPLQDAGLQVNTPTYGVAQENGRLYVRLPNGADPNGESLVLPRAWHVEMLQVVGSPYVHIDGFWFEGGGDQSGGEAAVTVDAGSQNGSIMNCVSTVQRTMARVPGNYQVRWCEHFYPGFKEVTEAMRAANGNPPTTYHIWDYVKNYNRNAGTGTGGNAYYEGSIYRPSTAGAPVNVHGEHLYVHEVFDGLLLGEFEDSSVSTSVFDYIYDDCLELENNQTNSDGSGLEVYENLFGNSLIWLSRRSPESGPIFVYRNVLYPHDDPHGRGPHMIKTGGTADLYVYFNTLVKRNGMDHGTAHLGWGSTDAVTWNNDVDEIRFRSNAVIFEDGQSGSQPALGGGTDDNLLYSSSDDVGVRGGNGVFVNRDQGTDAIGFTQYGTDWTPSGANLVDRASLPPAGWNAPNNDWSTDDIGCFQVDNPMPEQWPRPYDRSDPYGLSSKHFERPRVPPQGWR